MTAKRITDFIWLFVLTLRVAYCEVDPTIMMAEDYMDKFSIGQAYAITMEPQNCLAFPTNSAFTCITYESDNLEFVREFLALVTTKRTTLLFFLPGENHTKLLTDLNDFLNVFNSLGTFGLMEEHRDVRFKRQLNTRIFTYSGANDSYSLNEIYAVKGDRIEQIVGKWTSGLGWTIRTPAIWDRRSDFGGVVLSNRVLSSDPLTVVDSDERGKFVGARGPYQDILRLLGNHLNFTVDDGVPADGKWGSTGDGGETWSGLVGMLAAGQADVVSCGLTPMPARSRAVDFTIALQEDRSTFVARLASGDTSMHFWAYLGIFPRASWALVAATLVLIAAALAAIRGGDFFECAGAAFLLLLQLNPDSLSTTSSTLLPSRILFVSASIGCYLLFIYYTSDLTSLMTATSGGHAVKSFRDVITGT